MIKAIFFDVDGTLFSHRTNSISDSSKLALKKLKQQGIKSFVATGRHILELKEMPMEDVEDLEFEGFITLNGQYCYNRNEVIYSQPIYKNDLQNFRDSLKNYAYASCFFEKDRKYLNYCDEAVREVYQRMASPIPEIINPELTAMEPVYQISVYGIAETEEWRLQKLMPNCQFTRWHSLAIDVLSAQGGKARGIEAVLSHYGIKKEECMAFGDAMNDIEMLDYVGIGIAMGNGKEQVKSHADYVTEDAEHDGIMNALKKYDVL